jgi:hypothetical protein
MADQVIDSASGQADVQSVAPVPPSAQPAPIGWRAPRPARVSLGWLAPEQGEFLLASRAEARPPEAHRTRVRKARDTVAARPVWGDRAGLVSPLPAELCDHAARLGATPGGTAMQAEGWEIAMVDLDEIVAFQTNVFTDTTPDRVAGLEPGDLESIASLTLPISDTAPVSVQYDQLSRSYTITSPNPNLRVVGNFDDRPANGPLGFGFGAAVTPSYLQVARIRGRLILRDGYHRSFGLLSRGITHVPAYVRDFDTTENLAPAGMLPQNTWLGDRPPMLRDYHDDRVAASVLLPAQHRMIVIHAIETLVMN